MIYKPNAKRDLNRIIYNLRNSIPFTFLRFNDGEVEILRNRFLEIDNSIINFKGKKFTHNFPIYDKKLFDPNKNIDLRKDLLESCLFRGKNYFKGIVTYSNTQVDDREFLIRLNGGIDCYMTFADLLVNSNYLLFREKLLPLIYDNNKIAVIANHRAKFSKNLEHATFYPLRDNFFDSYVETFNEALNFLIKLPKDYVVLSSASSLSNILGFKAFKMRPDLTFIDVGTSINDLLGLESNTRKYHTSLFHQKNLISFIKVLLYKMSKEYRVKW